MNTQEISKAVRDGILDRLPPEDGRTIRDMLERAKGYGGRMTEKQERLASWLIERAKPAAKRETVDLSRINQMFDHAAKSLKRPFVNFLVEGGEFKVSPAGADSRNPGFLYVKRGSEYQGKISPQGEFAPGRDAAPGILEALRAFAADPVKAAFAYGQETGNCCFCARELTDPRSVEVGYGPTCAERYGLAWG